MKKAERLLDLITFLLNASRPVTFEEIQNAFPDDYREGQEEAIARKFERDKADIIELGLPLRYQPEDEEEQGGYVIDRDKYSMPSLNLAPEELAMLYMVGTAALQMESMPFQRDLLLALNKILYATGEDGRSRLPILRSIPGEKSEDTVSLRRNDYLDSLQRAITNRKSVILFYHSLWRDEKTKRKVDPMGLVCSRGAWFLVAYCHLRQEIRVFHVDRITGLEVNRFKPKTPDFEIPEDLRLQDHVAKHPWEIRAHEGTEVVVRFEPPVASTIESELGSAVTRTEEDGDARIVYLNVTFLEGLLPTILSYRDHALVQAPREMVEKVRDGLEKLALAHGAGNEA